MELQDYLDLVPAPNRIKQKFMEWFEGNVQIGLDTQALLQSYDENFDINKAVGKQLDIIGELLGLPRSVNFDPGGGGSPVLDDDFYRIALIAKILRNTWHGTVDEVYDFWQQFLPQYPVLIQDNQDMTMSVLVAGMPNDLSGTKTFALGDTSGDPMLGGLGEGYWEGFQGILRGLVTHGYFTPKPAAVSVNYAFKDEPVFALGVSTELMKGLGEGSWVSFN